MAKGDSRNYQGDQRDSGRDDIEASSETIASADHKGNGKWKDGWNEDAAMGDVGRLQSEIADPPSKIESINDLIVDLAKKELANADKLKERNVHGVFDGVSTGGGLVASRIASEKISEIMSHMPKDADAERARRSIEAALGSAHQAIQDVSKRMPEVGKTYTTADLAVPIDNGDGTYDVAYGHSGDSRIYVLDGETGKIRVETIDDGFAGESLRSGDITREEYDQILNFEPVRNEKGEITNPLPGKLSFLYSRRNVITRGLGISNEFSTGIFKVKKGDKMLISSDGIHDNLTAEQIAEIMRQGGGVKELAQAAYGVASLGEGRAKPDDITGTVVEFGGEGKEASAAAQETAGRPTAEQLQQWQQELSHAATQIGALTRLEKIATQDRIEPQDMVSIADLKAIDDLGPDGIKNLKREWQLHSLDRKKVLLQQQIGEQALQEVNEATDALERMQQLHIAAWSAEAKSRGAEAPPIHPAREFTAAIDKRIRNGENPADVLAQISRAVGEMKENLNELESSRPQVKELKMAQAEYDRLLAEKMRADKLKADADKAAEEEKIRQQLATPAAPPRTTPSAQQGPRMARVMPAVQVPEQRREQPPFISRAEIDAELNKQQQKKEPPKKKGWLGRLLGGKDDKEQ